ncbi:hypothetical protein [Flagellimonas sp. CMM7]|uniref:hypothetical protein n=1 Tax=Flagellimonas sp. CMM7 TaxID=2654676 RepID=UPI0013D4DF3A|nr:hypothetical protein [Flagellimonas sp. CMM7]UII79017.1 hypothetical protein LV704_15310 [Flagellimonas sp. CMM7]
MPNAYLEITLKIDSGNRKSAAAVYSKYKQPFLDRIKGAKSKQLLVRAEDVQVIHTFDNTENASAYLSSNLFAKDIVEELKPYLTANPDVRVYSVS